MSIWTHVVGIVRIDGLPGFGDKYTAEALRAFLGEPCLFEDLMNGKDIEGCKFPYGSEGSLQYNIVEYYTGIPWVIIPIWGDLRNYDSPEDIEQWFRGLLAQLNDAGYFVRDYAMNISCEYRNFISISSSEDEKKAEQLELTQE